MVRPKLLPRVVTVDADAEVAVVVGSAGVTMEAALRCNDCRCFRGGSFGGINWRSNPS